MDKKDEWRTTRGKRVGTDTEERESHLVCREREGERERGGGGEREQS